MMKDFFKQCKENEPAFCTVKCPFNLDVCEMMNKIQRGNFKSAYRLYQNTVAFPVIVSALCNEYCKKVCPRRKKDAAIELRKIEKAVIENTKVLDPQKYSVPRKTKKVAVIGAGISGLSCALKLCLKRYDVVVFEKSDRFGGHLYEVLSPDIFIDDIKRQFKHADLKILYGEEIRSLDDERLKSFDAVYIATGADCAYFREPDVLDENRLYTDKKGVFAGGSIKGAGTIYAISHGIRASVEIEKYLLTGIMKQTSEDLATNLCQPDLSEAVQEYPCKAEEYSREQAVAETERCLKCSCDACQKKCDLINFYNKSPLKIMDEVRGTTEVKSVVSDITVATKMISSCNQCGYCREVCPEKISFEEMFLNARQALFKSGRLPWAFNDFFLRDMENAHENKCFFVPDAGTKEIKYLFFAGCQLGASDPRYVLESYRLLSEYEPSTALLADCCGAPAIWAGINISDNQQYKNFIEIWEDTGKPEVVFACATCMKMIQQYNKDVKGLMLYELFDRWGIEPKRKINNASYVVFDPCSARKNKKVQAAVRSIIKQTGADLKKIDTQGERAKCCGYGGHSAIVNPEYTETVTSKRISESDLPYITYCSNCRDIFAHKGKEAVHILDLIFDLNDEERKSPTFTQRRENRRRLKERITMLYEKKDIEKRTQAKSEGKTIVFSDEIRAKISDDYMLEEELEQVIRFCEETGDKMVSARGNYVGHLKIGHMTYWVEYDDNDDHICLINAYSHRIAIQEGNRSK